jgi:hypothetical protein
VVDAEDRDLAKRRGAWRSSSRAEARSRPNGFSQHDAAHGASNPRLEPVDHGRE